MHALHEELVNAAQARMARLGDPNNQISQQQNLPQEIDTPAPYNVFHFPEQKLQTFVGLLEATKAFEDYWPALAPKFQNLINFYSQSYNIWFSDQAQLETTFNPKDQELSVNGQINLMAGINGLIDLLRNGETQKDVTVFMVISGKVENQNRVEEELAASLDAYKAITSQFNISLHVLAIGQDFPHSTLELIKQALSQRRDKNILFQIQVAPSSKNYAEILRKKFAKIEECLTANWIRIVGQELPTFPGATKTSQYISTPYFVTPVGQKLIVEGRYQPKSETQPLESIDTLDQAIGVCQSLIDIVQRDLDNLPTDITKAKSVLVKLVKNLLRKLNKNENEALSLAMDKFSTISPDEFSKQILITHGCRAIEVKDRRTLAKWGLSTLQFEQCSKELYQVLQTSTIDLDNSDQDRSVVNFVNQKDIIGDQDYLDVLEQNNNPYDALRFFPLVGQGLMITRVTDFQNMWYWTAQKVPVAHSIYDSASLYYKGQGQQSINLDGGTDIVNLVLPLFNPVDNDLAPLLKSKFFDTIMTLQVLKTADIYHPEAMATLLSRYLVHLMSKPSSTWRTEQLDLIYNTFKLKYDDYEPFNTKMKQLLSTKPHDAFLHPLQKDKITPPTMIILLLFILQRTKPEEIQQNFNYIITATFFASFANKSVQVAEAIYNPWTCSLVNEKETIAAISTQINNKPKTLRDFQEKIYQVCSNFDYSPFSHYTVRGIDSSISVVPGTFDTATIKPILTYFKASPIEDLMMVVIHQIIKYPTTYLRITQPFSEPKDSLKYLLHQSTKRQFDFRSITEKVLLSVLESTTLVPSFIGKSQQFEKEELTSLCQEIDVDETKLQYNYDNKMIKNSCTCAQCYFYLRPISNSTMTCWCQKYLTPEPPAEQVQKQEIMAVAPSLKLQRVSSNQQEEKPTLIRRSSSVSLLFG